MGKNDSEAMEKDRQKALSKVDSMSKEDLFEGGMDRWADELLFMTRILISQVGKEKAKELIEQAKYDESYKKGQAIDSKVPRTLDGFREHGASLAKGTGNKRPWVSNCYMVEDTKNKSVSRCSYCAMAEALQKAGEKDPETFEVLKWIDVWDTGRANGFNPDMKFTRTKWLLDGDDYCEFVIEE